MLLWVLGCGLGAQPVEWVDSGCACLRSDRRTGEPRLQVHLACADCFGQVEIDHACDVDAGDDRRLVVHASARTRGACPTSGSCSPMVLDCELPPVSDGPWTLVYGKAEVPIEAPFPATDVCACPGSMHQR